MVSLRVEPFCQLPLVFVHQYYRERNTHAKLWKCRSICWTNVGRVKSVLTNGADFQKFMKHYLFFRFYWRLNQKFVIFIYLCNKETSVQPLHIIRFCNLFWLIISFSQKISYIFIKKTCSYFFVFYLHFIYFLLFTHLKYGTIIQIEITSRKICSFMHDSPYRRCID